MVKTVILDSAETRVDSLGGQNAVVKNLSDNTIWASVYPNVAAGADNVVEIPAGSGEVVLDSRGTVYLLGTGKVQCTGTDYSTVNFKMPSSSASGGGGDKPSGEMPVMTGIDVFDLYETYESFKKYPVNTYNHIDCPFPLIMYMVFIGFSNGTLLERSCVETRATNGWGLSLGILDRKLVGGSGRTESTLYSDFDAITNKTCCAAIVSHPDGGLSLYVNGTCAATREGETRLPEKYLGGVCVNGYWRDWGSNNDGAGMLLYALAIGHEEHTSEQIIQNSRWLMQKYGIGGG